MKIESYECAGALRFGEATKDDCVAAFGKPERSEKSRDGEDEYHYDGFIIRFGAASHRFRECTLLPQFAATISHSGKTVSVTWDREFLRQICALDGAPVVAYGFLILRRLGVAITGLHDGDDSQLAITVFSQGDFDEFMGDAEAFEVALVT